MIKKIRVLHLLDEMTFGGKEQRMLALLKGLQKQGGFSFRIGILSHKIDYSAQLPHGVKIHFFRRNGGKDLRVIRQLDNLVREFRPHIVHSWESMCSVYSIPLVLYHSAKFVNGMITNTPPEIPPLSRPWLRSRLTFPFSDTIVANSFSGLRAYRIPLGKGICIHNGFDFSRLNLTSNAEEIRRKFNISTPHIIGMIAMFFEKKDYPIFIETAKRVLDKRQDVTFIGIGEGTTLKRMRALVPPNLRNRILFPGKQNDILPIVNTLRIGVLLSRSDLHGEGISNSVMEYMALGKPVVVTDSGGSGELVENGVTGFLVPPFDVDAVQQKLEYLLEKPEVGIRMGEAGKEKIEREFSQEQMVVKFARLYRGIVNGEPVARIKKEV